MIHDARFPNPPASRQITMMVASELDAIVTTEGGGGATVIPTAVKAISEHASAVTQYFLAREVGCW